ncbi:hypothetical protein ACFQVD_00850 [Streptosporangium amethystogenes subsp. fukuiense]|uniref:Uncharacterized protein n=1 Tax=Streptosporangium amethystogenes subsp. fukuiense TaxID=698418 RepID=A0ABW2SSK9_9ACTN
MSTPDTTITFDDINDLAPDVFERFYREGKIDHLVANLEVFDRDADGTVTGFTCDYK